MNTRRVAAAAAVAGLVAGGLVGTATPAYAADPYTFTNTRNPILGDGSYYSADPAPLVVPAGAPGNPGDRDELYIYTGHDEAGPSTNDFIMNEWGAFRTTDVGAGQWTHHPSLMRPEQVFSWATPGQRIVLVKKWRGRKMGAIDVGMKPIQMERSKSESCVAG